MNCTFGCPHAAASAAFFISFTFGVLSVSVDSPFCAPNCKPAFVGDGHCDLVCNLDACGYDGGDCGQAAQPQLKRMVVMGPFYKNIQRVEYHVQSADGSRSQLTMEEGRRWEGLDDRAEEEERDWERLFVDDESSVELIAEPIIWSNRPPWNLDRQGNRVWSEHDA